MSKENAMRFFMSMEMNSDLKSKYVDVVSKGELQTLEEAEKDKLFEREILPIAKGAGFEFSIDELKEFQASLKEGELSDEDLDQVVGGEGQMRYSGCIHCSKFEDPEYIKKAMATRNGDKYVCPGYEYHPHYASMNRCVSCEYGYFS